MEVTENTEFDTLSFAMKFQMRFPKSKTTAADNTPTNTAKTCCPAHLTKMGKIKTLEANPDGTGPQIWEDASSSTYITRQAGTQFSVR